MEQQHEGDEESVAKDRHPSNHRQQQLLEAPLSEQVDEVVPGGPFDGDPGDAVGSAVGGEHVDQAPDRDQHGESDEEPERPSGALVAVVGIRQEDPEVAHRKVLSRWNAQASS